ncbi:arsenic resistance protein [Mycetocola reblochoni]|uniref:Symporter n=1 Tax=Mycetocola reblochoni TaxID=331618 RepID=A0A3L6ZPH7_9MICO|nr:bile acid:sodium symporter [Mycetocola reblochoni]RLP69727.1 symporter [Mycetocola reblochoni]
MLSAPARSWLPSVLFVGAILAGSVVGLTAPTVAGVLSSATDALVLLLVAALFAGVRPDGLAALRRAPRAVGLVLVVNLFLVPLVALAVTAWLPGEALRLGVLLYCLAPCTDWFLGFTRLAGGDTVAGAALVPVQLTVQILLFPLWLAVLTGAGATSGGGGVGLGAGSEIGGGGVLPALALWFLLPAAAGVAFRLALRALPPRWGARALGVVDRAVPVLIAAVILAVFASHVRTILGEPSAFVAVLAAVAVFFAVCFVLAEAVAALMRSPRPERVLLGVATSARNAPLMLALTTIALPDEPVVQAAIVLGMLIEFPHLVVITQLLRRRTRREARLTPPPSPAQAAVARQSTQGGGVGTW